MMEQRARARTSSAVDRVRESIDKLRELPLDEIDKELYALECKREDGLGSSKVAAPTPEDDVAISEAIHQVECELEEEKDKITNFSIAQTIVNGLFFIAMVVAVLSYYLQHVNPKAGEVLMAAFKQFAHFKMPNPESLLNSSGKGRK